VPRSAPSFDALRAVVVPLLVTTLESGWGVIASNFGSRRQSAGLFDLRAHPIASLHLDGVADRVRAVQVHGVDEDRVREAGLGWYRGYTENEERAVATSASSCCTPSKPDLDPGARVPRRVGTQATLTAVGPVGSCSPGAAAWAVPAGVRRNPGRRLDRRLIVGQPHRRLTRFVHARSRREALTGPWTRQLKRHAGCPPGSSRSS